MSIQHLQRLFQFNYWGRDKILSAATKLSPEQWAAPQWAAPQWAAPQRAAPQRAAPVGCDHGSLQGTLVHTLSAEWVWRVRCQERQSPGALLNMDDFPTPAALQAAWAVEQQKMTAYLAGLDDGQLDETISYHTTRGQAQADQLWYLLYHLIVHGVQHRAEAGRILTDFGSSPGDIDLIHFLRDQGRG